VRFAIITLVAPLVTADGFSADLLAPRHDACHGTLDCHVDVHVASLSGLPMHQGADLSLAMQ